MGLFNPMKNIWSAIVSTVAEAGHSFSTAVTEFASAIKFGVEKLTERQREKRDKADKWFKSPGFKQEVRRFQEALDYMRSREQMPRLDVKDVIPDALKIQTSSVLKGKFQYMFDFQGQYDFGYQRPSEMVSLLSDTELTQEQAYEEMYRQILNKQGTTFILLNNIEELTFVGVRTSSLL